MKNQLEIKKRDRISPSHRRLLVLIWKIHQGLRNGTNNETLKNFLDFAWDTELRDHFLNEEIFISSNIKNNHLITDTFFHHHDLFRKKVKQALAANECLKEIMENICILLIEMVRYEEKVLKPFLIENLGMGLLEAFNEDDTMTYQDFTPQFWKP